MHDAKRYYVLGICGGSGSGKTYTVTKIKERLPVGSVSILNQDSYYKDLSHLSHLKRSSVNFDHPNSIDFHLLKDDLEQLIHGSAIKRPAYDFKSHTRIKTCDTIDPSPIIIVEGHHIFSHVKMLEIIDHKVFLDIELDIRFIRRLMRDIRERGRDVEIIIQQYLDTVRPMDFEFVQPAKKHADTIINSHDYNQKLSEIVELLMTQFHKRRGAGV